MHFFSRHGKGLMCCFEKNVLNTLQIFALYNNIVLEKTVAKKVVHASIIPQSTKKVKNLKFDYVTPYWGPFSHIQCIWGTVPDIANFLHSSLWLENHFCTCYGTMHEKSGWGELYHECCVCPECMWWCVATLIFATINCCRRHWLT